MAHGHHIVADRPASPTAACGIGLIVAVAVRRETDVIRAAGIDRIPQVAVELSKRVVVLGELVAVCVEQPQVAVEG